MPVSYWPQQSPIGLSYERSVHVPSLPSLEHRYDEAPYTGTFQGDEGHRNFVLTKPHPGLCPPMIRLGEIRAQLVKIHLHVPSEHDFEGKNEGGELHLIHEIVEPTRGSTLLVLGVLFHERADATTDPMRGFCRAWADKCNTSDVVEIDPRNLLPTNKSRWYRYEGSLTTAPYDEIVSWLVFEDVLEIPSTDLALLREHAEQPERLPQPLNRRFVLRSFE